MCRVADAGLPVKILLGPSRHCRPYVTCREEDGAGLQVANGAGQLGEGRLPVQVAAIVIGARCVRSVRDELPACALVGALVDGEACHAILFERDEDAAVVSSVRLVLELDERDVGLPVG